METPETRTVKYSYRAVPTASQQAWLAGAYGAVRVIYNSYIWDREQAFETKSKVQPRKLYLASVPDISMAWLNQYPTVFRQQAQRQAQAAYGNFFKGLNGLRKDRPGKPSFKRRRAGGSLTWTNPSIRIKRVSRKWGAIRLPKQGSWLRFRISRDLPSKPTGVTLKLSPAGEYTVSFTVQQEIAEPKTEGPAAGVDLGLLDFVAVVSDDGSRYKISAPKHYKRAERKLARLQQAHSRKQKGSKNRERARIALAKQYAHVAAQRLDGNRKIAFRLASENQAVSLEALNLRGLVKSKLSKSFADAGLGQLATSVEQVAQRLGTRVERVNPAYTSQACSACGTIDGPKPLAVREWECACGARLDRDYNAALNVLLLAGGHSERLNGPGGRISRGQLAGPAMPSEGATSYTAHKPRRRRTRGKSLARRARLKDQTLV